MSAQLSSGTASALRSSTLAGSYLGSQTSESLTGGVSGHEALPVFSAADESYMLNGIVSQVGISRGDYEQLLQSYDEGHIFTAQRLPARKRSFQFRSQRSFNL